MKYGLGIDIGGTNTKIGLVSSSGDIVASESIPTESHQDFSTFTNRVYQAAQALVTASGLEVVGVGVGAPNANSKSGNIENPPNLEWQVAELQKEFGQAFALPVRLENDANVAAVGERLWGQGKDTEDFVVITIGTGIGTGIYSSGQLINSFNGMASEGGHLSIERNGRPCGCGGQGHLEAYASVSGIKQTVKEITGQDMKFAQILELYASGDPAVGKAIEQTAEHLGYGAAQMFSLLMPKRIILAGGGSNLGPEFCQMVNHYFQKFAYMPFGKDCQVTISDISTKNGAVLGAASLSFL